MAMRSRPIPNIIQGVSQQTAEERRDAQCEAEKNIVNYPTRGATARYGADIQSFTALPQLSGAFCYEVLRGTSEHYLFIVSKGLLNIYDLNTFEPCLVTPLAGSTYLQNPGAAQDQDVFRIQTVGDYHFIANRNIVPQMSPTSTSQNPNPAAIVFVQAGNYLTNYTVSVEYQGSVYNFTYQTPDNSVASNYQYIATNQIAATFFRAMTGAAANSAGSGPVGPGSTLVGSAGATYPTTASLSVVNGGLQAQIQAGSGNVTGSATTLTALGFTVKINGNLLLIERAFDQNPFTVDASDGSGDSAITVVQDEVQGIANLPKGGFSGYVVKVNGVGGNTTGSPYYLKYDSTAANGGAWIETVANNVEQNFAFSTMPVAIFCSGPGVFEVIQPNWLPRISGDGTTSAFQPGFVGSQLTDLAYFDGRLCLLGQSTYDFTMADNVFNFWPQTAQTVLDAAPISGQLAASNTTSTLQRSTVVDEQLILWAQRAQFRVNSGIQSFTATNIQDPQSTSYEFNQNCPFFHVGTSVYFAYDSDGFSRIFILQYQQGRAVGDTEITAHVPEYIPAGVRAIQGSVPIKMLFVRTDGAPNSLYLYNWLSDGESVVQSAWNEWDFPEGQIIWHTVYQQFLYMLIQRTDGCWWATVPLNAAHVDAGGNYTTRLDMRVTEVGLGATYNPADNTTVINLPYVLSGDEQANYRVVIRATSAKHIRGTNLPIKSLSSSSVTVAGNVAAEQFYCGFRIRSTREESPFYVRTSTGHIPTERLTVKNYWMNYRNTIYTHLECTDLMTGEKVIQDMGIPGTMMLGAAPTKQAGSLRIVVDKEALGAKIVAVNDSPYPSEWTSVNIEFDMQQRATPMLTPYGGPVQ